MTSLSVVRKDRRAHRRSGSRGLRATVNGVQEITLLPCPVGEWEHLGAPFLLAAAYGRIRKWGECLEAKEDPPSPCSSLFFLFQICLTSILLAVAWFSIPAFGGLCVCMCVYLHVGEGMLGHHVLGGNKGSEGLTRWKTRAEGQRQIPNLVACPSEEREPSSGVGGGRGSPLPWWY